MKKRVMKRRIMAFFLSLVLIMNTMSVSLAADVGDTPTEPYTSENTTGNQPVSDQKEDLKKDSSESKTDATTASEEIKSNESEEFAATASKEKDATEAAVEAGTESKESTAESSEGNTAGEEATETEEKVEEVAFQPYTRDIKFDDDTSLNIYTKKPAEAQYAALEAYSYSKKNDKDASTIHRVEGALDSLRPSDTSLKTKIFQTGIVDAEASSVKNTSQDQLTLYLGMTDDFDAMASKAGTEVKEEILKTALASEEFEGLELTKEQKANVLKAIKFAYVKPYKASKDDSLLSKDMTVTVYKTDDAGTHSVKAHVCDDASMKKELKSDIVLTVSANNNVLWAIDICKEEISKKEKETLVDQAVEAIYAIFAEEAAAIAPTNLDEEDGVAPQADDDEDQHSTGPFYYEITSASRSANISDIVADLMKDPNNKIHPDFEAVYAEKEKGSVSVAADGVTVTVRAGGEKDTDAIKIYDNQGSEAGIDPIIVYVYNNDPRVDSSYDTAIFQVKWNDNKQTSARPSIDDATKANYELKFSIDGGQTYYSMSDFSGKTGITAKELGEETYNNLLSINSHLFDNDFYDRNNETAWTFDLSTAALPKEYTVGGQHYSITYQLEQKKQYDGYTSDYVTMAGKLETDSAGCKINGEAIINTRLIDYRASLEWRDNENAYGSRPSQVSKDQFEIYMLTTTAGASIKSIETDDSVAVKVNGDQIILSGLPNYDEKGNPVHYALKPVIKAETYDQNGDSYQSTYKNVDNYSSYKGYVFNGGKVIETLTNTTHFRYSKNWGDENKDDQRGTPKLYLYVMTEDKLLAIANGTEYQGSHPTKREVTTESSAVSGYTAQQVPNTQGIYTFENNYLVDSNNQPISFSLYDEYGRRLVYYGLEVGATDFYTVKVQNKDANPGSDQKVNSSLRSLFNSIVTEDGQVKYVLNDGQIDNNIVATVKVKAEVTVHASALQSGYGAESSLILERKNPITGKWEAVKYSDYPFATKDDLPDQDESKWNDPVTFTLEDIDEENGSKNVESLDLLKYENGEEIEYRFRQTKFDINGGTTEDISEDAWIKEGDHSKTEAISVGKIAPGIGSEQVDLFVEATAKTEGDTTLIDNYISSPLLVKVVKTWRGKDIGEDAYVTIDISQNGAKLSDKTMTLNEGNEWDDIRFGLNRFDQDGREYTYGVTEFKAFDGTNYSDDANVPWPWWTEMDLSYRIVDTETGEEATEETETTALELLAEISNVYGPGHIIEVGVQKEWHDGGDVSSEQNAYMALYHIDRHPEDDRDSFGIIGIYPLNKKNAWYEELRIGANLNDTIYSIGENGNLEKKGTLTAEDYAEATEGDYIFVEIGTGDQELKTLNYVGGKTYTSFTNEEIMRLADQINGGQKVSFGRIASDEDGSDPDLDSEYTYKVEGYKATSAVGLPAYFWSNTRMAQSSFDLTKTWKDGGKARIAQFELTRESALGDGSDSEVILTFETEDWKDGYEKKGDIYSHTFNNGISIVVDTSDYSDKAADGSAKARSLNFKINGLQKYDENGELYRYYLAETAIYDESKKEFVPVDKEGNATVNMIHYSVTCDVNVEVEEEGTRYGERHHDGDVTYWKATNTVSGQYPLDFYKVWYDSGIKENPDRPNIFFDVYRASTHIQYQTGNPDAPDGSGALIWIDKWIYGDYTDPDSPDYNPAVTPFSPAYFAASVSYLGIYLLEQAEHLLTVTEDRLYDASNQWLWEIALGTENQYDDLGYPYVYFAIEGGVKDTDYEDGVFYGNMSSEELELHKDSVNGAKSVYDIYDVSADFYNQYKTNKVLVISDGVHSDKDGDYGNYYRRTVVNARSDDRTISGTKVWNLPDGWTMDENEAPEATFELWRTIEEYPNVKYTKKLLMDWFESLKAEDSQKQANKVVEFKINSNGTTVYDFKGNSYAISKEPVTDAQGIVSNMNLQKYDRYGYEYNYYVVEKDVEDKDGNSLGYAVQGYPSNQVEYNFGTYHTENNYLIQPPFVKIVGEKAWSVSEEVKATLKEGESFTKDQLAPVKVTLYAQAVSKSGKELTGADPIEISSQLLDPKDASYDETTDKWTLSYTFDKYTEFDANSGIPYVGPNSVPFKFFVTESLVPGYESTLKYSVKDGDNVSYDEMKYKKDADGNLPVKYITLYKISDGETEPQYSNESADGKDASFENVYSKVATSFKASKVWADDYVDNDQYRPDELVITIGRKYADGSIDEKFAPLSKSLYKADYEKASKWEAIFGAGNENSTDPADRPLAKYAPDGKAYTYYIVKEEFYNGSEDARTKVGEASKVADSIGHYELTSVSNGQFVNTLTGEGAIEVKKIWKIAEGNAAEKTITFNEFQKMRAMGVFPAEITYLVQRADNDSENYYNVSAASVSDESKIVTYKNEKVLGYKVNVKEMTNGQFAASHLFSGLSVKWNHLPNASEDEKITYHYRVIEVVKWNDDTVKEMIPDAGTIDGSIANRNITTAYSTENGVVNITNTSTTEKVRIAKVWDDNHGRDNTRPAEIDVTITPLNSEGRADESGRSFKLKATSTTQDPHPSTGNDANVYYSDYFTVASDAKMTYGLSDGENGFEITESWTLKNGAQYNQTIISTDSSTDPETQYVSRDADGNLVFTIKNTYHNNRKVVSVEANKNWAGESDFIEIARPYLKFTLQYKTQGTNGIWTDFTDSSLAEFIVLPTPALNELPQAPTPEAPVNYADKASYLFPVEKDTDGNWINPSQKWEYLKKYWDTPSEDGIAEAIEYRVREDLVDASGNLLTNNAYTANPASKIISYSGWGQDSKTEFTASITNTLDSVNLKVKKKWHSTEYTAEGEESGSGPDLTWNQVNNLINLGAIPEKVKLLVEYKIGDGEWIVLPSMVEKEEGSQEESYKAVTVSMQTLMGSDGYTFSDKLPKVDKNGNEISYRVRETHGIFKIDPYKRGQEFEVKWTDNLESGILASMDTTPSSTAASSSAVSKVMTTELENNYLYTSRDASKIWEDENNRDGSRPDSILITLYRDYASDHIVYGTADISTGNASGMAAQFTEITKGSGNKANEWYVKWNFLPLYQNGVYKADGSREESIYWWTEKLDGTSIYDSRNESGSTDPYDANGTWINSYQPIRGDITVRKNWKDYDNAGDSRPSEIYVKLQWSTDGKAWQDVQKARLEERKINGITSGKTLYTSFYTVNDSGVESTGTTSSYACNEEEAYTTSNINETAKQLTSQAAAGWITLKPDANDKWPDYTWKDLPKNAQIYTSFEGITSASTVAIQYRVIEGVKVDNSIVAIGDKIGEGENAKEAKLDGYKVSNNTVAISATQSGKSSSDQASVTNTLETTELILSKKWEDDSSYKNLLRPDSVTFTLEWSKDGKNWQAFTYDKEPDGNGNSNIQNGVITVDAEDWKTSVNVPKKAADGTEYQYRVSEASITYKISDTKEIMVNVSADKMEVGSYDIESAISQKAALKDGEYSVEATNTLETSELTVTKKWEDAENRDGGRPNEIKVQLYRIAYEDEEIAAQQVGNPVALKASEGWTYTWTDLPIYRNDANAFSEDNKSIYYVAELTKDGEKILDRGSYVTTDDVSYTVTYQDALTGDGIKLSEENSTIITNTHTPKRFSVEVSKEWLDDEDDLGLRPESITLKLQYSFDADAKEDEWTDVPCIADLPAEKDEDGFDVYTTSGDPVTGSNTQSLTKDDLLEGQIWGTLTWENLPANALAEVSKDGETVVISQPVYYRVTEVNLPDSYELSANVVGYADRDNNGKAKIEAINTLTNTKEIKAVKIWEDDTYIEGSYARPDYITVQLQSKAEGTANWKDVKNGSYQLSADDVKDGNWVHTWIKLPLEFDYRVIEKSMTYTIDGESVTLAVDATDGEDGSNQTGFVGPYSYTMVYTAASNQSIAASTMTNSLPLGNISLEKTWIDEDNRDNGRENIYVQLYMDDTAYGDPVEVSLDQTSGKWTTEWNNLPVYRAVSGQEISKVHYYVAELNRSGVKVGDNGSYVSENGVIYTVSYHDLLSGDGIVLTEDETSDTAITNTHEVYRGSVSLAKDWEGDSNNEYGSRPENIEYTLEYKAGDEWEEVPVITQAELAETELEVYTSSPNPVTVAADDNYIANWNNLPVNLYGENAGTAVEYRVVESEVDGYITLSYSADQVSLTGNNDAKEITVTNELKTSKLSIQKNWDEVEYFTPAAVGFLVEYRHGGEWTNLQNVELTANDNWATVIEDLPYLDGEGNAYSYRVSETYIKYNNASGESVQVEAKGSFDSDNAGWNGKVGIYDVAISQTVDPDAEAMYSFTANNNVIKGSLPVEKIWLDYNNRDGGRKEITVELYRDNQLFRRTTLNAGNDWKDIFEDLPVYQDATNGENHAKSIYSVKEEGESNGVFFGARDMRYTVEYSQPTSINEASDTPEEETSAWIKNSHEPLSFAVNGVKVWNDDSDDEDIYNQRPDVHLEVLWTTADNPGTGDWHVLEKSTADYLHGDGSAVNTTSESVQLLKKEDHYRENRWEGANWQTLPAYANVFTYDASGAVVSQESVLVKYKVTEIGELPSSYTSTSSNVMTYTGASTSMTAEVINSYDGNTFLTVTKVWEDFDQQYVNRPESVTVKLQYAQIPKNAEEGWTPAEADWKDFDSQTATVNLTADSNVPWSYTWLGLRDDREYRAIEISINYADGTSLKGRGTLTEGQIGAYSYKVERIADENATKSGCNITNSLIVGKLQVTKTWEDAYGRDGYRPDTLTFELYRDGGEDPIAVKEAKVTREGIEDCIFENLPVHKDQSTELSEYYIIEKDVDGYAIKYSVDPTSENIELKVDDSVEINVNNRHETELFQIQASKLWEDDLDQYGLRPEEVELKLQYATSPDATGDEWKDVIAVDKVPEAEDEDGMVVFTTSKLIQKLSKTDAKGDGSVWESVLWKNLPAKVLVEETDEDTEAISYTSKMVYYRVVEANSPSEAYGMVPSKTFTYVDAQETGDLTCKAQVKNPLNKVTSVKVVKTWTDNKRKQLSKYMPGELLVSLQYRADQNSQWAEIPLGGQVTLNAANNWTAEWKDLRADYEYRVVEISLKGKGKTYLFNKKTENGSIIEGTIWVFDSKAVTQKVENADGTFSYLTSINNKVSTKLIGTGGNGASEDGKGKNGSGSSTGDHTPFEYYLAAFVTSMSALFVLIFMRRRRRDA